MRASVHSYRLAATGRQEAEDERLSLLEEIFDPLSRQWRAFVQPGWRCLEVAAGRGSMAVWLAQQVGTNGRGVATDVDTSYLNRLDLLNLEVHRHNILSDPLDTLNPVHSILSVHVSCCFGLRANRRSLSTAWWSVCGLADG